MNRICPILLLFLLSFVSYGQQLANQVCGTSGEEVSNSEIILNHTSGEFVSSTINNSEITLTQGFQQTAQLLYISPKAMLQGALIGTTDGLMRDNLRVSNKLPYTSPYEESVAESNDAFTVVGNDAIADWAMVKIRNADHKVVGMKSALMQRDGDLVSADGVSPLQFSAYGKEYFVEINHRNHFGTMTKDPITLSGTPTELNFTLGTLPTYGNYAQAVVDGSLFALWAGDVNNNGIIRYLGPGNDTNSIKDAVLGHPTNTTNSNYFPFTGYHNADINLNGVIRYLGPSNDTNILKDIIRSHPLNSSLSNYFLFLEQLPN